LNPRRYRDGSASSQGTEGADIEVVDSTCTILEVRGIANLPGGPSKSGSTTCGPGSVICADRVGGCSSRGLVKGSVMNQSSLGEACGQQTRTKES